MGVTLERVQNKFACIIGELCSEPIVLSQFAIWLDLRLAEYKAKGAISLDCSGDNPDPVWMNGHRLPQQTEQKRHSQPGRYGPSTPMSKHRDVSWSRLSAERESSESPGYDPQVPPSDNLPSVEDRLSPSSVMVKDEPTDSDHIFPVSLHRHEMSNMSNRKRTAAEAIAGSHDGIVSESLSPGSSTTPKTRRVSPDADQDIHHTNSDPSTNQSLMSIISGDMDNHPTETVDLTESDINIIMEYENKEGISQPRDNSRPSFSSPPAAASGSSEYSTRGDDSFNTAHGLTAMGRSRESEGGLTSKMAANPDFNTSTRPSHSAGPSPIAGPPSMAGPPPVSAHPSLAGPPPVPAHLSLAGPSPVAAHPALTGHHSAGLSTPVDLRASSDLSTSLGSQASMAAPLPNVKMDASFALLMMSAQPDNAPVYNDEDTYWWTIVKPAMYPQTYPETLSNKNIRVRLPEGDGKPQQTVVDIVTAVGTLERWMWKKYSETRPIETMQPDLLNRYLTEFYPLLRRPNGKEYDPKSLTNFKSRLDRFLKENHYPCSINKSDLFATSQQAFANKRRAIVAKRSHTASPLAQTSDMKGDS